MQNSTQFFFSVMFILSLGFVWGVLYKVYMKAALEERAEKAKNRAARSSITPPPPPTSPTPPEETPPPKAG